MNSLLFSAAGTETTATTLTVFMLAMTLYPEVMVKAQAQIDYVVGRDRVPTFADKQRLPYIEAMVKELLRWRPVDPMGVPRRTSQVCFSFLSERIRQC